MRKRILRRRRLKKRIRSRIGKKFFISSGIAAAGIIGMNVNYLGFPINFAAFQFFFGYPR